MKENIDFLTSTLTLDFVNERVPRAVERLKGEPEWEKARQLESDLLGNQEWISVQELIELRTAELPALLGSTKLGKRWSV